MQKSSQFLYRTKSKLLVRQAEWEMDNIFNAYSRSLFENSNNFFKEMERFKSGNVVGLLAFQVAIVVVVRIFAGRVCSPFSSSPI